MAASGREREVNATEGHAVMSTSPSFTGAAGGARRERRATRRRRHPDTGVRSRQAGDAQQRPPCFSRRKRTFCTQLKATCGRWPRQAPPHLTGPSPRGPRRQEGPTRLPLGQDPTRLLVLISSSPSPHASARSHVHVLVSCPRSPLGTATPWPRGDPGEMGSVPRSPL